MAIVVTTMKTPIKPVRARTITMFLSIQGRIHYRNPSIQQTTGAVMLKMYIQLRDFCNLLELKFDSLRSFLDSHDL